MRIQRLDAGHVDAAAATLAEAFFDDPLLLTIAPDEVTRRREAAWFIRLTLRGTGLTYGEVWGNDDASAVAIWLPPAAATSASAGCSGSAWLVCRSTWVCRAAGG